MSLYAVTKVLGQIWGPLFSRGSPRPGGTGALPPALGCGSNTTKSSDSDLYFPLLLAFHLSVVDFCQSKKTKHLPSLHCTVSGFALDWESHKSLKHDRECLTELLERAFFQPYPIQRIQQAEVGWESDIGDSSGRGWVVCIKPCATFSVLV